MMKEVILILDFGSPYTQLLAQRVRENHVFSRIVPYNISTKQIKQHKPKGIILSGAPSLPFHKKKPMPERGIFKLNIPILGICYGAKVIVGHFAGRVKSSMSSDSRISELFIDDNHRLFWQMPNNITCWMSYTEQIKKIPRGFKRTAHTQDNPIAAIECPGKKIFAVTFHPEVVDTQRGNQIISNFLYRVCGCIGTWTMDSFVSEATSSIKKAVGKDEIILNLTSSPDTYVTALLINKAIKRRLRCIFIDNGLLGKDEAKQIKKVFTRHFHLNLNYIDRSKRFLSSLKGIVESQEKRKIIRNLFVKIFQEELKKKKKVKFLALGTTYTDINKPTAETSAFKLKPLQPLVDLFKDEVRVIAKELGLADNMTFRQPFPESGLAVRIIGEVTASRLKILREAESCLTEEIKSAGIYEQVWQSFAILIPNKNVIAIRCIASTDGITADWVRLPYELLEKISRRILNKVKGVTRVVYDISTKPPATIEWE